MLSLPLHNPRGGRAEPLTRLTSGTAEGTQLPQPAHLPVRWADTGGSSVGTEGTEVFHFIPSWGSINLASQQTHQNQLSHEVNGKALGGAAHCVCQGRGKHREVCLATNNLCQANFVIFLVPLTGFT